MQKIFYFILFITSAGYSQNYVIEYNVKLNSVERTGVLIKKDRDTTYYFETSIKGNTTREKNDENGNYEYKISLKSKTDKKRYQIYLPEKDTLLNIDYIDKKEVLYSEIFPKIEWKIKEENKNISNYNCTQAITNYRGRNYIAWFTTDLPSGLGPWKFNNLPGAILQVYDETNSFSWSASKINFTTNSDILNIDKSLRKLTLKQFVNENEEYKKKRGQQMILKYVERGATVSGQKHNRGREKTFEWEIEETKKD